MILSKVFSTRCMDDTDDPIVHDEEQDEMLSFCSLFLFNVVLLDLLYNIS